MPDQNSNDGKSPWDKRPDNTPPDLIELLTNLLKKKKKGAPNPSSPKGSSDGDDFDHLWQYIGFAVLGILALWLLSGIFIVSQPQQAVIQRFGRYIETVGPGVHWIPPFISRETRIDVQQVRTFNYQSEMLTKDENIVNVALAVQYRIQDPRAFLFNVVSPVKTLEQATSSALRQTVGTTPLDAILTTGREQLRNQIQQLLISMMSSYEAGITITDVTLQPAKPPEEVTQAFDDAIKAREDEQRYINQAQAYSRSVISRAAGQVARLRQLAEAYRQEVVLAAQGQVARYNALLTPYLESPVVTRERLYLDTVSSVLSQTTNVVLDSGNNVMYLPIDQILKSQQAQQKSSSPTSTAESNSVTGSTDSSVVSTTSKAPPSDYGEQRPSYPSEGGY